MANSELLFSRGQYENLSSAELIDGQLLLTEDNAELYVDIANDNGEIQRKRINNNQPGRPTEDHGEIFNNYEKNAALTQYSTAEGDNTIAGCKGFACESYILRGEAFNDITSSPNSTVHYIDFFPKKDDTIAIFANYINQSNLILNDLMTLGRNEYNSGFLTSTISSNSTGPTLVLSFCIEPGQLNDFTEYLMVKGLNFENIDFSAKFYDAQNATIGIEPAITQKTNQILSFELNNPNIYDVSLNKNIAKVEIYAKVNRVLAEPIKIIFNDIQSYAQPDTPIILNRFLDNKGIAKIAYDASHHTYDTFWFYGMVGSDALRFVCRDSSQNSTYWIERLGTGGDVVIYDTLRPELGDDNSLNTSAKAEGDNTQALMRSAHAEGRNSKALDQYSHAEGRDTLAVYCSHAEGRASKALGEYSHTEGYSTKTTARYGHAEGFGTQALAQSSHAEGEQSIASGNYSHAGGFKGEATGVSSFAHGDNVKARAIYATAFGYLTQANSKGAIAIGDNSKAEGEWSFAGGQTALTTGGTAFAFGNGPIAKGNFSMAIGHNTTAWGQNAFAFGDSIKKGYYSVGEKDLNDLIWLWETTSNEFSNFSLAYGDNSIVGGFNCFAAGKNSAAFGNYSLAKNENSIVFGDHVRANFQGQAVFGKYNASTEKEALFTIGNGNSGDRKNAFVVYEDGHAEVQAYVNSEGNLLSTEGMNRSVVPMTILETYFINALSECDGKIANAMKKTIAIVKYIPTENVTSTSTQILILDPYKTSQGGIV